MVGKEACKSPFRPAGGTEELGFEDDFSMCKSLADCDVPDGGETIC